MDGFYLVVELAWEGSLGNKDCLVSVGLLLSECWEQMAVEWASIIYSD